MFLTHDLEVHLHQPKAVDKIAELVPKKLDRMLASVHTVMIHDDR